MLSCSLAPLPTSSFLQRVFSEETAAACGQENSLPLWNQRPPLRGYLNVFLGPEDDSPFNN